ncbi:MAG: hypothetical protein KF849_16535, partial [Rhizobiaceae bacterium]|nr:hypothetical protein [Rhizobiaceae bacterium]
GDQAVDRSESQPVDELLDEIFHENSPRTPAARATTFLAPVPLRQTGDGGDVDCLRAAKGRLAPLLAPPGRKIFARS